MFRILIYEIFIHLTSMLLPVVLPNGWQIVTSVFAFAFPKCHNLPIVIDAAGTECRTTPLTRKGLTALRRVAGPALAAVAVCTSTVLPLARPAAADQLSSVQAQASALEAKINQTGSQISALNEQYNAAQYHLSQIKSQVAQTQAKISKTRQAVSADTQALRHAAIDAYVSNGTSASSNPLFDTNTKSFAAKSEYSHVAAGTLNTAVNDLTNSQDRLTTQEAQLQSQQSAAQAASDSAANAVSQAKSLQAQQAANLAQVKGQIATIIKQHQAAQAAAQAAAARQTIAAAQAAAQSTPPSSSSGSGSSSSGNSNNFTPPPPVAGAAGAVAAAESQIGVPYVWGASSPGVGFDCSGLVMWAWGQAGVSLPHFSGAQFAMSTPVPTSALQPGDLLFYGPGGSDHVAMYVGGGMMIEAPQTGYTVHITPVRFDYGFVGAGRP